MTKSEQSITVTAADSLSGVESVQCSMMVDGVKQTRTYTCDENNKCQILSGDWPNGIHTLTLETTDRAGNRAVPLDVEIKNDRVEPQITAAVTDPDAFVQPMVNLDVIVGDSSVEKVEVISQIAEPRPQSLLARIFRSAAPASEPVKQTADITNTYREGYKILENGTYSFRIQNRAGVEALSNTLVFDTLEELPVAVISAYTSDDRPYVEGTYADQTVRLNVKNSTNNMGTGVYEYRTEGGDWTEITPVRNQYWLKVEQTGIYNLQFRIRSYSGTQGNPTAYTVKIDKDRPAFTYEMSPDSETLTNEPVTLRLDAAASSDVQYSFNGGRTFGDSNSVTVYHNGIVRAVVRSSSGTAVEKRIVVPNLDMEEPVIHNVDDETISGRKHKISVWAEDKPATAEYASSGMRRVFLTQTDPYRSGQLRVTPRSNDKIFKKSEEGFYTLTASLDYSEDTGGDNGWIVAVDNVGNGCAYSLYLETEPGRKPEKPPIDDGKPGDGSSSGGSDGGAGGSTSTEPGYQPGIGETGRDAQQNESGGNQSSVSSMTSDGTVDDSQEENSLEKIAEELKEIEEAKKETDKTSAQEKYLNEQKERLVNQALEFMEQQGIPKSFGDIRAEEQLIRKLLEGNLTQEQREVLIQRLESLQSYRQKTQAVCLLILFLIIGGQLFLLLRRRRRRRKKP